MDNRSSPTTMDADGNPRNLMDIHNAFNEDLWSNRSAETPSEVAGTDMQCTGQEEEKHDGVETHQHIDDDSTHTRSPFRLSEICKDSGEDGAQSFLANVLMDYEDVCERMNDQGFVLKTT